MGERKAADFDLQKILDDARQNDRPQQDEAVLCGLSRRVNELAGSHHRTDDDQPRPQCRHDSEETTRRVADAGFAAGVWSRHGGFQLVLSICH